MLGPILLERLDATTWLIATTLAVFLLAAWKWPWIEASPKRQTWFWVGLSFYAVFAVVVTIEPSFFELTPLDRTEESTIDPTQKDIEILTDVEVGADIQSIPLPQDLILADYQRYLREKREKPSGPVYGAKTALDYRYFFFTVSLSQTDDWRGRVSAELVGSSCSTLRNFVPTKLRVRNYGSDRIKVDVFRSEVNEGMWGATLIREGFSDDYIRPEGSGSWRRTGWFASSEPCSLQISILLDEKVLDTVSFLLQKGKHTGRKGFSPEDYFLEVNS